MIKIFLIESLTYNDSNLIEVNCEMVTCPTGKKVFITQQQAEDALIEAYKKYDYKRGGPVTFYKCDECGHYHFTSQGKMNERLAKFISEGNISLHREAARWEEKFKKK